MSEAMYDLLYIIQVVSDCMLSMSAMMYVMWFVMEKKWYHLNVYNVI
jgi:hypothetical protein